MKSTFRTPLVLASLLSTLALTGSAIGQAPQPMPSRQNTRSTTPAAVPDVVRIPRPSKDDIAAISNSLDRFIQSADPKTKALLEEYPYLLKVQEPKPNSAIVPNLAPFFMQKHQANVEVASKGDIDVLFMGDSITDFWRNESGPFAGKQVFDEHFGTWKVANFGIAGDTTQGVLYRLRNGEGEGFDPGVVMLMIGTNNTSSNSPAEIAEGIGAVVMELEQRFEKAKIMLLAVFPRGSADQAIRGEIKEINERIAGLHDGKRVFYLDIGSDFLDENGNIPQDVMSDGLHPTSKGYQIWAEAVKPKLTELKGG